MKKATRFLLVLFAILITTVSVKSQTISYPVSANAISVCFDSTLLTVQVTGATSNPNITVTLPSGIFYIPGSFNFIAGNGSVSESGTSSVPVFTITGATSSFTFTIKRRADCTARSFALAGGTFKDIVKVDAVVENAPLLNSYNVKYATLTITQPASVTNVVLGSNIIRNFSFRNTGQGCVDTVYLEIDYSTAGLIPNGDITVDGVDFSPIIALSTATKKLYKIFGTTAMIGGLCESDPAVAVSQPVKVTGCIQVPVNYKASWGSNAGQLCQSGITTGNITVLNTIPMLGATVVATPATIPFCAGTPYASFTATVSNTGNGPAANVKFYISNFSGNAFQNGAAMAIDTASVLVNGVHPSGIVVSVSPSWQLVKGSGSPTCIAGQPGQCLITMPAGFSLPPAGSFTVKWSVYNCNGGLCDDGFAGSFPGIKLEYDNECGTQHTTSNAQTLSYGLYNQVSGQAIQLPAQVFAGDCFNYIVGFSAALGPVTGTNSTNRYAELKLTLPLGMSIPDLADNIKEVINNLTPHAGFPKQVGQDVYFRFSPAINNEVKFKICTQAGGPPCGNTNIAVEITMVNDSTCAAANRITSRKCFSKSIEVICPGASCTSGGVSPAAFSFHRSSYGQPDNNQDGKPDETGTIDLNKIDRDRYRPGDTLHSEYRGGVLNQTSPATITNWNNVVAEWTFSTGTWQAATASIVLKRGGIIYTSTGVPITTLSTSKNFRANWNGIAFMPAFPLGGYIAGDSVIVMADFVYLPPMVTSLNKTTISDVGFDAPVAVALTHLVYTAQSVPVAEVVNGSTGFTCSILKYNGNIIGHQNLLSVSGAAGSSCNNITSGFTSSVSLLNGTSQKQYFYYEHRPIVRTDSIIYNIPAGWEYVGPAASSYFYTIKSGSSTSFSSVLSPQVTGSSTTGYTLKYDINAAYHSGSFPFIGTEGLYFNESMLFRPGCNTPDSATLTVKDYGHFISYPSRANPASYVNTQTALKTITYSGTSKPGVIIADNTGLVEAATETNNYWDVQITGANFNAAKYVWLATEKLNGGIDVVKVECPVGTAVTASNTYGQGKNIYSIASTAVTGLTNPGYVVARIYFTKTGCGNDSLKVRTGWDCGSFALSANNICSQDIFLKARSSLSEIQLIKTIEPAPNATVDICNEIDYKIKLISTQNGDLDNPLLKLTLPPGTTVAGNSFTITYPDESNPETFTISPSGNVYTLNLEDHGIMPASGLKGLISATGNDQRIAGISLKLRVNNCSYVSGVSPSFQIFGDRPCDGVAIGNALTVIGNPVVASNQSSTPELTQLLTIPGNTGITCDSPVTIKAVINSGDGNTVLGDSAVYYLPASIKYKTGSFSILSGNISSSTLSDNQLVVRFPSQTGNTVTLQFDVEAAYNGCTAPNYEIIGNLLRSSGFVCPLSFGSCQLAEIKHRDTVKLQILKPQLATSSFSYTQEGLSGNVTINYNVAVTNSGNRIADAGIYLVKIYCSSTESGKVLHSFNTSTIGIGATIVEAGSFQLYMPADCTNGAQLYLLIQDTLSSSAKACLCLKPTSSISGRALPVILENFAATIQHNIVKLNWVTGDEINVARYEVEFSTNTINYKKVASVTATNSRFYSIDHTEQKNGLNYYRLKIIDKDGKAAYSEVRKINYGKNAIVTIFPNPTRDIINVAVSGVLNNKFLTMSLVAMDGKILLTRQVKMTSLAEAIDVSRIATGKYHIRIITDDEVINKIVEVIR